MNNLTNLKNTLSNNKSRFLSIQMTRKLAMSKFANWILCFCHIRVLAMGNSSKEAINIMKPKQIIISILAVLFVFPLMGTFAQQAANSGSIEVITTFDYPGTGNQTLPQKINERGDIVGEFIDSNGVTCGFVRFSDGSFSDPIVDPNDTVGFTEGRGINNSRTVAGDYATSDGNLHGFFLSGGTFTEYDVPGSVQTNLLSINDAGDFTGGFDPDGSGVFQAFVSVVGTFTSLNGINDRGFICGRYVDASGIAHGFLARVRGIPPTNAAGPEMKAFNSPSLATPLNPSPSAWGGAIPAR